MLSAPVIELLCQLRSPICRPKISKELAHYGLRINPCHNEITPLLTQYLLRTTSTVHFACEITAIDTDPIKNLPTVPRPCEPKTIISAPHRSASSIITFLGEPSRITPVTCIPELHR
jgi:hypothetical protein